MRLTATPNSGNYIVINIPPGNPPQRPTICPTRRSIPGLTSL